jgi:hypothetical protein
MKTKVPSGFQTSFLTYSVYSEYICTRKWVGEVTSNIFSGGGVWVSIIQLSSVLIFPILKVLSLTVHRRQAEGLVIVELPLGHPSIGQREKEIYLPLEHTLHCDSQ